MICRTDTLFFKNKCGYPVKSRRTHLKKRAPRGVVSTIHLEQSVHIVMQHAIYRTGQAYIFIN